MSWPFTNACPRPNPVRFRSTATGASTEKAAAASGGVAKRARSQVAARTGRAAEPASGRQGTRDANSGRWMWSASPKRPCCCGAAALWREEEEDGTRHEKGKCAFSQPAALCARPCSSRSRMPARTACAGSSVCPEHNEEKRLRKRRRVAAFLRFRLRRLIRESVASSRRVLPALRALSLGRLRQCVLPGTLRTFRTLRIVQPPSGVVMSCSPTRNAPTTPLEKRVAPAPIG